MPPEGPLNCKFQILKVRHLFMKLYLLLKFDEIHLGNFKSDWKHNLTSDRDPPDLGQENLEFVCDLSSHYILPIQEFSSDLL